MDLIEITTASVKFVIGGASQAIFSIQNLTINTIALKLASTHPHNYHFPKACEALQSCEQLSFSVHLKRFDEDSVSNLLHNKVLVFALDLDKHSESLPSRSLQQAFESSAEVQLHSLPVQIQQVKNIRLVHQKQSSNNTVRVVPLLPVRFSQESFVHIHALLAKIGRVVRSCQNQKFVLSLFEDAPDFEQGAMTLADLPNVYISVIKQHWLARRKGDRQTSQSGKGQELQPQTQDKIEQTTETQTQVINQIGIQPQQLGEQYVHQQVQQFEKFKEEQLQKPSSQDYSEKEQQQLSEQSSVQQTADQQQNRTDSQFIVEKKQILVLKSHILSMLHFQTVEESFLLVITLEGIVIVTQNFSTFSKPLDFDREYAVHLKQCRNVVLLGSGQRMFVIAVQLQERVIATRQIFVERKIINDMEYYPPLNCLVVAGVNLSKLAFLGKQTTRTNLKAYQFQNPMEYLCEYRLNVEAGAITACNYYQPQDALCLVIHSQKSTLLQMLTLQLQGLFNIVLTIDFREMGIMDVLSCARWLDKLLVLEHCKQQFVAKLVDLDRLKTIILNKQVVPVSKLTVFGIDVCSAGFGDCLVLKNGKWVLLSKGEGVVSTGQDFWVHSGQKLQKFSVLKS